MIRKWFGMRPGRIDVVLGLACTGQGASIALVTSDGGTTSLWTAPTLLPPPLWRRPVHP